MPYIIIIMYACNLLNNFLLDIFLFNMGTLCLHYYINYSTKSITVQSYLMLHTNIK
jgi:hypothetical protein